MHRAGIKRRLDGLLGAARTPASLRVKRFSKIVRAFDEGDQGSPVQTRPSVSVPVTFKAGPKRVSYGENLRLVGSPDILGGWEVGNGVEMAWDDGDFWTATVDMPAGLAAEFKLVQVAPWRAPVWEFSPNRALRVADGDACAGMEVTLGWDDPKVVAAVALPAPSADIQTAAEKTFPDAPEQDFQDAAAAVDAFSAHFKAAAWPEAAEQAEGAEGDAEQVVEEVVEALAADADDDDAPAADVADESAAEQRKFLKNAAKTAGYVAMGALGAVALSVLAVDIADTAVLGALAAAAGGAALANGGGGKKRPDGASSGPLEGRGAGGEGDRLLAAGLLSALDAGKAAVQALDGSPKPPHEADGGDAEDK